MNVSAAVVRSGPGAATAWLAVRQIRRGGLIVLALVVTMPAVVVATYGSVTADPAALAGLDDIARNVAVRTLFGEPMALGEPGGFTVWRIGTFVAAILGVWSVLATTRITRGEEDAGRWAIVLAGRIPLRGALARHLVAVCVVPVAAGAGVVAVLLPFGGPDRAGAVVHGAGLALFGVFAVGVAALAAQVFPARAPASGAAVALLAIGLLTRMVGDGVPALSWLRWLSPFGLLELSAPYARNAPLPLLVLALVAAAVHGAALVAAGRRDAGAGLLPAAGGRRARTWLLVSVEAFAVRRAVGPLAAWSAGICAYFLVIGLTATSLTDFLTDNATFADKAAQAGFAGLATVDGFAAALYALLSVAVGAFSAVRLAAFTGAESDRRLTLLTAQPVGRLRLLGADTVTTLVGALVLLGVAAASTWIGVTAAGGHLGVTVALGGAVNTVPIVLLSLGAALFAVGVRPSAVVLLGCVPATGGFLLKVIAEAAGAPGWIGGLSPYSHLAPVPLAGPDWPGAFVMTGIAAILTAAGAIAYRRRDLAG